jgi:hypothetical protein
MDRKRSWIHSSFYSVLILNTGDLYLKKMAESSTSGIWVAGDKSQVQVSFN